MFHPAPPGWNLPRKREDAPWASAPEFALKELSSTPGAPALEFALTKLRTSPGAPAFVFHPAPSGWNLLWKRENHTRGPHTFPDTRDKLVESRLNGLKQRGNVWGGLLGWV